MQKRSSISLLLFFVWAGTVNGGEDSLAVAQAGDLEFSVLSLDDGQEFETFAVAYNRHETSLDPFLIESNMRVPRRSSKRSGLLEANRIDATNLIDGGESLHRVGYSSAALNSVVTIPPTLSLGAFSESLLIGAWTVAGIVGCVGAVWYRRKH